MTGRAYSDDELLALLDAYLDDELDPAERSAVDDLLRRSAEARDELDAIARVRAAVRGLPAVEPPTPLTLRQHRSRRRPVRSFAMASLAAAAAVVILAATFTPVAETLAPPLDRFVERHEAMASEPSSGGFVPMPLGETASMPRPAGFEPMALYAASDAHQLVLSDGDAMVSVFEQPGRVDWASLPAGGEMMMMGDDQAWHGTGDTGEVVVVERDGHVLTVVSGEPADAVMTVADEMPASHRRSLADRVGDAMRELARTFGYPA
jgi:anti-sigma factor RsiW